MEAGTAVMLGLWAPFVLTGVRELALCTLFRAEGVNACVSIESMDVRELVRELSDVASVASRVAFVFLTLLRVVREVLTEGW